MLEEYMTEPTKLILEHLTDHNPSSDQAVVFSMVINVNMYWRAVIGDTIQIAHKVKPEQLRELSKYTFSLVHDSTIGSGFVTLQITDHTCHTIDLRTFKTELTTSGWWNVELMYDDRHELSVSNTITHGVSMSVVFHRRIDAFISEIKTLVDMMSESPIPLLFRSQRICDIPWASLDNLMMEDTFACTPKPSSPKPSVGADLTETSELPADFEEWIQSIFEERPSTESFMISPKFVEYYSFIVDQPETIIGHYCDALTAL
jgi:hypothetical protein